MRAMLPRRDASVLVRAPFIAPLLPNQNLKPSLVRTENQALAHMFMICSNIKLTGAVESIGLVGSPIHEWNQWDSGDRKRERGPRIRFPGGIRRASPEKWRRNGHGANRMLIIMLDNDTDFEGWRKAARRLALNDVKPADVTWTMRGDYELFSASGVNDLPDAPHAVFNVSAIFVELAKAAILN